MKIEQFKGLEISKIKDNIEKGTTSIIKENEKIVKISIKLKRILMKKTIK